MWPPTSFVRRASDGPTRRRATLGEVRPADTASRRAPHRTRKTDRRRRRCNALRQPTARRRTPPRRPHATGDEPRGRNQQALLHHHPDDGAAPAPERDPIPDLLRPPRHRVSITPYSRSTPAHRNQADATHQPRAARIGNSVASTCISSVWFSMKTTSGIDGEQPRPCPRSIVARRPPARDDRGVGSRTLGPRHLRNGVGASLSVSTLWFADTPTISYARTGAAARP